MGMNETLKAISDSVRRDILQMLRGGSKSAGFGLGFERAIMYLTGISNIRDVVPFPRTVGNADF